MINSTLCYIKKNNQYLLLHRVKKDHDLNHGKWIGVGGKFEPGESADECVVREVYEETGLTITKFFCHGIIKFISGAWEDQDMYLYTATEFEGELISDCPEGELKWVDADEVLKLPTWEGDKYFMEPLLSGQKRIDMVVRYDENDNLIGHEDLTEELTTLKASNLTYAHGFSTRTGGVSEGIFKSLNLGMNRADIKERVIENWNRFLESCGVINKEFVCGEQVHKNNVHIATIKDLRPAYGPGKMNVADGYVTNLKNVPLAIFIADCVPVLLEDIVHGVIGAVHCGWRSTVLDIQKNAIDAMLSLGATTDCINVAIGPAIDKCCFEVGGEVIEAVEELLGKESAKNFYEKRGEKFMLDLRGVVKERFLNLNIKKENIEIVGDCTMCNPKLFWSHRYTKGERGSQAAVIEMN